MVLRRTRGSTLHLIGSRLKLWTRMTSVVKDAIGQDIHVRRNFRKHPDFNHSGRWEGCKADRELRVSWKYRADGTRLTTGTSAAPNPPRHNDAPTPAPPSAGDRDHRRRRDNDRRDRDRDRRDHGVVVVVVEVVDKSISKRQRYALSYQYHHSFDMWWC